MDQAWREGVVRTARHTSFYLECGPADGPLLVFLHGWPELSISWRHQLPCFAAMGFRCVAPDMRGYGRSSSPSRAIRLRAGADRRRHAGAAGGAGAGEGGLDRP